MDLEVWPTLQKLTGKGEHDDRTLQILMYLIDYVCIYSDDHSEANAAQDGAKLNPSKSIHEHQSKKH
jgi:hypothetical protein